MWGVCVGGGGAGVCARAVSGTVSEGGGGNGNPCTTRQHGGIQITKGWWGKGVGHVAGGGGEGSAGGRQQKPAHRIRTQSSRWWSGEAKCVMQKVVPVTTNQQPNRLNARSTSSRGSGKITKTTFAYAGRVTVRHKGNNSSCSHNTYTCMVQNRCPHPTCLAVRG